TTDLRRGHQPEDTRLLEGSDDNRRDSPGRVHVAALDSDQVGERPHGGDGLGRVTSPVHLRQLPRHRCPLTDHPLLMGSSPSCGSNVHAGRLTRQVIDCISMIDETLPWLTFPAAVDLSNTIVVTPGCDIDLLRTDEQLDVWIAAERGRIACVEAASGRLPRSE